MAPNDVDRTIHPYATGRAAETAQQHHEEKSLKLYAGW